jgi:hypothetical protein
LIFLAGICGSRSPDLCNNFPPSWSPDLVLISVFVSIGAARFRFTRSLLLVVVPCWTGSDLFLSSSREQAQTDGEEVELPSSFSAAVPFAGQVPFPLFASRKPARASAQSGRKYSSLPLSGSSCISFSRVPGLRFTSGACLPCGSVFPSVVRPGRQLSAA